MNATKQISKAKRPYLHEVDFMRLFFIFGVLLNHTINIYIAAMAADSNSAAFLKNIRLMFHFSRNGFLLISGLVLTLNYYDRHDWKTFYKKRFNGSIWPYLTWNFLLLSLLVLIGGTHFTAAHFKIEYYTLVIHGSSFHMYFMLLIMQLYLAFPAIVWLFKKFSQQHLILVSLSFIFQIGIDLVIKYLFPQLDKSNWPYWFKAMSINAFSYQFYFILGTYLCLHYKEVYAFLQAHIYQVAALAIALSFGTIVYVQWWNMGVLGLSYDAATSPHQPYMDVFDTLMILTVFWVGKQYAQWREQGIPLQVEWFIKNGAKISFGIYLDQTLGLVLLERLLNLPALPSWGVLLLLPAGYLLVAGCSYLFAFFCYRIAPFGYFIGRPQWHPFQALASKE
ncbi:acyltransferase [Lactobacillus selangorensis]|uniref:Acyltransferase n=1 Tax=Lactobacillus selangorensis TaxID=81857 RepID=A0A0R2FWF4_9LACO|nr:acyltransferase [Lactobacillus selangorensis]KRN27231.1 acyltransferase [Lactobacillus selangorensis]KRN29847.1 acyltransferase [Lactobacillus selangorensis]